MDYKLKENKESLVKAKDALISDLDSMFTTMIDSDEKYKKAALLYYWLRDYKNYIKNEDRFDHSYLPAFKRGDIININFGFNLGSEHGGMHYGIVLADSIKKNPVVTVVPLKSPKEHAKLYYTDVDLSNELFDRWIFIFDHSIFKSHIYSSEDALRILYVGRCSRKMEL